MFQFTCLSPVKASSNLLKFSLMRWAWTAARTPQGPPLCWTNPKRTCWENPKDWWIQPSGINRLAEPKTSALMEQAVWTGMGTPPSPPFGMNLQSNIDVHVQNFICCFNSTYTTVSFLPSNIWFYFFNFFLPRKITFIVHIDWNSSNFQIANFDIKQVPPFTFKKVSLPPFKLMSQISEVISGHQSF